jgi:hypothetical protein
LPIPVGIVTVITTIWSAGLSCSHDTFCIDGEVGSLSKERASEDVHWSDASRRFPVQRQLFRAGTLDGLVVISNSFLAQCPQKPTSSAPFPRLT